jgi:release factor glutamine methyltransferase
MKVDRVDHVYVIGTPEDTSADLSSGVLACPGPGEGPDSGGPNEQPPGSLRVAIAQAAERLADAGVPSPRHDAEELAALVLGCPRGRLFVAGDLSAGQRTVFRELVARRASRVPLQHLTGSAAFRHLEIAVGPGVFVPRPETEVVAGWCVDALHERAQPGAPGPLVVDLCTGSAAIALSIAYEVPGATVHGVERESAAYEWASRNAIGSRVVVHHADAADALAELDGAVDLVVGNPPYLPESQRDEVDPEVRDHDPDAALWGGPDGLAGPRMIEAAARRLLRDGGLVAVEHADHHGTAVAQIFRTSGEWSQIAVRQDLAGRDRFVTARRDRA